MGEWVLILVGGGGWGVVGAGGVVGFEGLGVVVGGREVGEVGVVCVLEELLFEVKMGVGHSGSRGYYFYYDILNIISHSSSRHSPVYPAEFEEEMSGSNIVQFKTESYS